MQMIWTSVRRGAAVLAIGASLLSIPVRLPRKKLADIARRLAGGLWPRSAASQL